VVIVKEDTYKEGYYLRVSFALGNDTMLGNDVLFKNFIVLYNSIMD